MIVSFAPVAKTVDGALVVTAFEGGVLSPFAAALDKGARGAIKKAIAAGRFTGAKGQMLEFLGLAGTRASRVIVAGLGAEKNVDGLTLEAAGGHVVARLLTSGEKQVTFVAEAGKNFASAAEAACRMALGAKLRAYRFDQYRTKMKKEDKPSLTKAVVMTSDAAGAKKAWKAHEALADGVYFTRDLVSEPPNVLNPAEFARRCEAMKELGLEVEVLGEKEMKKLGMGALLGVGQGAEAESKLVVMRWNGDGKSDPIAFVGKGVCFDSGGISLKPGDGMWDMKWDMAGAGAVAGLMRTLAMRKAKVNVVGVIGLVENMPDGDAQRPGDIVTSMSGQTIEVWNTDAEGRLVLADALWYTQDRFKPKFMVDLATLTGAVMIALGKEFAAIFANDDELAGQLGAAGKAEGEKLWRLPMVDAYDRMIDSVCADMKNITGTRDAGSAIGAVFLQRFVNKVKWAHLDIAGVAWSAKAKATVPEGATAYGVRLLNNFVAANYEAKE